MNQKEFIIVVVILVLAAAIAGWYVWTVYQSPSPAPQTAPLVASPVPSTPEAQVTTSSLGASILEKAQNPLQGKVQEVSPTANPVKDVYKNPFE